MSLDQLLEILRSDAMKMPMLAQRTEAEMSNKQNDCKSNHSLTPDVARYSNSFDEAKCQFWEIDSWTELHKP